VRPEHRAQLRRRKAKRDQWRLIAQGTYTGRINKVRPELQYLALRPYQRQQLRVIFEMDYSAIEKRIINSY
jgi:hypothetical protein